MSAAEFPQPEHSHLSDEELLINAPEMLLDYIRSQFDAAYRKERDDDSADISMQNGSFYVNVWPEAVDGHSLLGRTSRIVMRPPFSVVNADQPYEFVEVYAVFLRGEDGHMVGDDTGYFADQYLVREHTASGYEPIQLVTEQGVFVADTSSFDVVAGFNRSTSAETDEVIPTVEQMITETFKPFAEADRLLGKLSRYNIVATTND